jgi:predicted nucleic acid-binding protein
MGITHILDTNILIGIVTRALPTSELDSFYKLIGDRRVGISLITYMEVYSKQNLSDVEIKSLDIILENIEKFPISQSIAEIAIQLRKASKVKLSDCIIAASSIFFQLQIVSNDEKDFSRIQGINWLKSKEFVFHKQN